MTFSQNSAPDCSDFNVFDRFGQHAATSQDSSRGRLIFLRALVWSLIGLIYAPLFVGLLELLRLLGWTHGAYLTAAALASAIGAVLYGAREISLMATVVGTTIGVAFLMTLSAEVSLVDTALLAAVIAALIGLIVPFRSRCSRHVPGKTLAGLMTGGLVGGVLALAESLHLEQFPIFAVLAFLISVNSILYVATVKGWVQITRWLHLESRPCYLIEALVMALLAGVGAGSVWMISAPLQEFHGYWWWLDASVALHRDILPAAAGAMFGGALSGILLELFGFDWVHDL